MKRASSPAAADVARLAGLTPDGRSIGGRAPLETVEALVDEAASHGLLVHVDRERQEPALGCGRATLPPIPASESHVLALLAATDAEAE